MQRFNFQRHSIARYAEMAMPVIGALTLEIHVEDSHSLKDKRHVVKSLKDRLRDRFNVSVAEIDFLDSWQRSAVAVVTVSNDRVRAEQVLTAVEKLAADLLGGALVSSSVEWL
jgi:uncharacterized protein YlxP (DUF503 family)